jgi:hypothetical protein
MVWDGGCFVSVPSLAREWNGADFMIVVRRKSSVCVMFSGWETALKRPCVKWKFLIVGGMVEARFAANISSLHGCLCTLIKA